ncbi:MAG: TIM barrel protein [Patescibacteria group bacterium]|nr:TIM barrel protein [Patescibacteria group bacterium]
MECGQYSQGLAEVLAFGKSIGCQVIQPSANHIDLARAATDAAYRLEVWNAFQEAEMPLTSVSIHCDTYAAIAVLDNSRAQMFTPPEFMRQEIRASDLSAKHLNKLGLMIIGAGQLGIPGLHLFWGPPKNLAPYGWAPQTPADVLAMRQKFVALVRPLVELAARFGVSLCHEIHFGTIAMTSDDLIAVWEMLGKPDNFCVGIDPSHFWNGETWLQAMDKLRAAGMKVRLAHAKNAVVRSGRPLLGLQMDDRLRGMAFTSLDDTAGIVSMWEYLGALTISGMVEFWLSRGLPAPVHVEAENPFFRINEVTAKGVKYLRSITDGLQLPTGHFTDAMRREKASAEAVSAPSPASVDDAHAEVPGVNGFPAIVSSEAEPPPSNPTTAPAAPTALSDAMVLNGQSRIGVLPEPATPPEPPSAAAGSSDGLPAFVQTPPAFVGLTTSEIPAPGTQPPAAEPAPASEAGAPAATGSPAETGHEITPKGKKKARSRWLPAE